MKVEVRRQQTPFKRFMAPMHLVKGRMEETDYRGCGFFNMLVEVADPKSRIAQAVRRFNDELRALLKELTGELVRSDARYAHLDVVFVPSRVVVDPELLFLPFEEGDERMGLPLAYRVVKNMGGSLTFSQHGGEAVFTTQLPIDPLSEPPDNDDPGDEGDDADDDVLAPRGAFRP